MNIFMDKVFLGLIAFILVACLILFYFNVILPRSPDVDFQLASASLVLFNVVIASSWFVFGWIGGVLALAVSVILTLSLFLITGSPAYCAHVAVFILSSVLIYLYVRGFLKFQTEYFLKREKIEEQKNTLSEKIEKDGAHAGALEVKFKRYEALKSVVENLSDIVSLDKITSFLAEEAFRIVGKSTRSLIYLVNAEDQDLELVYSKQPKDSPRIKSKKGDIFDKWVLRQNQPLIVLDAAKDFRFSQDGALDDRMNFKSLIAIPMVSHNNVIGLLRLDSRDVNAYNPDDLRLLDIIGDLGAVSLHNNMLYRRTTELAIKDGLTQLFVHRYFMERLENEFQRAFEGNHSLSILMIDIDHFKEYNDAYGHIAGDILLKRLGEIFTSIVSKGDIVARYGGEEFAVILFDEDKEAATTLAEKIRGVVERERFYLRREETSATVSIGVATFPDDAKSGRDLLLKADKMLYRAKREGRNRVCIS